MAYIGSTSIWDIARPHMERLVEYMANPHPLHKFTDQTLSMSRA